MKRLINFAASSLAASSLAASSFTALSLAAAPHAAAGRANGGRPAIHLAVSQAAQSPKGWSLTGSHREHYYLTTDGKVRHGGKTSATLISKNSASDEGFGSMKQEIKADEYRGRRIRYSGYLKTERAAQRAALWMRVEGADGKILAFDNMEERPATGTTSWKKYEIVLDVPEAAQHIALGAQFEGKGQIWADDLKLEVVGRDVASTDIQASPELKRELEEADEEYRRTRKEEFERALRQTKERLSTMPARPVNFDFES
ncbi:MAG TPA: hypothetical protein VEY11_06430 [Pyrinomonadaceae bacterium]|nr:hypothetical protein [Pyrinomonadaceae bacterium]